jgi:thioredoxin reductase
MIIDCVIIGGGPASLNAALVLGRAKRSTIVFDTNQPRNAVTQESHGFLTRDGRCLVQKRHLFRLALLSNLGRGLSVVAPV